VYGVDIDFQATEVTQLSLYLKLLENVSMNETHQMGMFKETILPNLNNNIVCGNSLIGTDIYEGDLFESAIPTCRDEQDDKLRPMNFEDVFPLIMKKGGFDAVVGNPPYGAKFEDYATVEPYVNAFNAESLRLSEILNKPLTLDETKAKQIVALKVSYSAAIQQPVAYMSTTFQANTSSQNALTKVLVAGSVPAGFYWLDANNVKVPMTFVQAQGLASAILSQGMENFEKLQTKKAAVRVTKTAAGVVKIVL